MKKFIAFEGIDGCGKSTQLQLLSKSLNKCNVEHYCTREPGGTKISDKIRKILVNKENEELLPLTELLLLYASRHEHVIKIILPVLKKKIILCDRFFYSTYCYQIIGNKVSKSILNYLHKTFAFNLIPDLTFIFKIDPQKSISRSLKIKKDETRYELKNKSFHKRVAEGFNRLSSKQKVVIFDGNKEVDEIHKKIVDFVNRKKIFKKIIPYYY